MSFHPTGGRTVATVSAGHVVATLWNPHATARLYLQFIELCTTGAAVQAFALQRATARGTPGSTITPNADNAYDRDVTNVAGALLDLSAYSVQPTLATAVMWRWNLPNVAGSGFMKQFPGRGIGIPPTTGISLVGITAAVPIADVNVLFED
jgi:hypothetical protein